MIIVTCTEGVGRYSSRFIARFEAGGTGCLQERRINGTECSSPIGLLSLGSESFLEPVLEPVENHASSKNWDVKGCNPDRIRASILFRVYLAAPETTPPAIENLSGLPTHNLHLKRCNTYMKQETFKNPGLMTEGLENQVIQTVEENGSLPISVIAKNIDKPYREVEPVVKDLVNQGKLVESGTRTSKYNRRKTEYEVNKGE
jgi:hypothetical protein